MGASIAVSAGLLLASVLILRSVLRDRGLIVGLTGLVGQVAAVSLLWNLITSSPRKSSYEHRFVGLALVIVLGGIIAIIIQAAGSGTEDGGRQPT